MPEDKLKGGDEYDALTGWRKVLYFKPGKRKKAKRSFRRRVRQQWRKKLKTELTDSDED